MEGPIHRVQSATCSCQGTVSNGSFHDPNSHGGAVWPSINATTRPDLCKYLICHHLTLSNFALTMTCVPVSFPPPLPSIDSSSRPPFYSGSPVIFGFPQACEPSAVMGRIQAGICMETLVVKPDLFQFSRMFPKAYGHGSSRKRLDHARNHTIAASRERTLNLIMTSRDGWSPTRKQAKALGPKGIPKSGQASNHAPIQSIDMNA